MFWAFVLSPPPAMMLAIPSAKLGGDEEEALGALVAVGVGADGVEHCDAEGAAKSSVVVGSAAAGRLGAVTEAAYSASVRAMGGS